MLTRSGIEVAFKLVIAALVVIVAGMLYIKGCSRKSAQVDSVMLKEAVSVQKQSIEISNKTQEKVQDEQQNIQQRSDAAVRTILSGKGSAVSPASNTRPVQAVGGQRPEGQGSPAGDLAGPADGDACDHACIMQLAWEAQDSARSAACKLRGKGSCDQPGRPTKQ